MRYVLRIPGESTGDYINRAVEATNAKARRGRAGVNAEVLFFDAADGLMLSRFLDGCRDHDAGAVPGPGPAPRRGPPGRCARCTLAASASTSASSSSA